MGPFYTPKFRRGLDAKRSEGAERRVGAEERDKGCVCVYYYYTHTHVVYDATTTGKGHSVL